MQEKLFAAVCVLGGMLIGMLIFYACDLLDSWMSNQAFAAFVSAKEKPASANPPVE